MEYSTVYSIIKEYNLYKELDIKIFSINNQKRRISTTTKSEKAIEYFIINQKESFTINDICKAVETETNKHTKNYIIRNYVKTTLKINQ